MRILVVDDNTSNRNLCVEILKCEGVEIHTATNGEEAVDMCKVNQYQVVLMDIMMPVMDGIEAASIIQHMKEPPRIIFITAYQEIVKDLENCDGIVLKPVNTEVLRRKVFINV